jgi:hypothetical protein
VTDLRSTTSSLISPAATAITISSPVTSYHPAATTTAANSPLSSTLNFLQQHSPTTIVTASELASPKQQELTTEQSSDTWFKSIYQQEEEDEIKEKTLLLLTRSPGEDPGNNLISPVSYTSHRPFVDDSHRLRYQDIEDDEMLHSNGSEENNHQGKFVDSCAHKMRNFNQF